MFLKKRCLNHWFFSLRCRNIHSTSHGRCKNQRGGASDTWIGYGPKDSRMKQTLLLVSLPRTKNKMRKRKKKRNTRTHADSIGTPIRFKQLLPRHHCNHHSDICLLIDFFSQKKKKAHSNSPHFFLPRDFCVCAKQKQNSVFFTLSFLFSRKKLK